jgi:hypothetical protein
MLVDPDAMVGTKTYCRRTQRLFLIQETPLVRENEDAGSLQGASTTFDGRLSVPCTHVIWYFMMGRYPGEGLVIDHWDGNVVNSRWSNLRECTYSQNMHNAVRGNLRWNGWMEELEQCVHKTPWGYMVRKDGVSYGTFKTSEEANAIAVQVRLEANGEFDFSRRPKRNYDFNDLATVIDTDRAVKERWYCPIKGRLFVCKQFAQHGDGLEYGVEAHRRKFNVRIERKYYGVYASAARANAVSHGIMDELWGDNGLFVGVRRRYWA